MYTVAAKVLKTTANYPDSKRGRTLPTIFVDVQ